MSGNTWGDPGPYAGRKAGHHEAVTVAKLRTAPRTSERDVAGGPTAAKILTTPPPLLGLGYPSNLGRCDMEIESYVSDYSLEQNRVSAHKTEGFCLPRVADFERWRQS